MDENRKNTSKHDTLYFEILMNYFNIFQNFATWQFFESVMNVGTSNSIHKIPFIVILCHLCLIP